MQNRPHTITRLLALVIGGVLVTGLPALAQSRTARVEASVRLLPGPSCMSVPTVTPTVRDNRTQGATTVFTFANPGQAVTWALTLSTRMTGADATGPSPRTIVTVPGRTAPLVLSGTAQTLAGSTGQGSCEPIAIPATLLTEDTTGRGHGPVVVMATFVSGPPADAAPGAGRTP